MWDIIEDDVNFHVDSEGMVVDRKSLIEAKKNLQEVTQSTRYSCGSFVSFRIHKDFL